MFRLLLYIAMLTSTTLMLASTGDGAGGVTCERWLAERAGADWFVRGQWVRGFSARADWAPLELFDRLDQRCRERPESTLAPVVLELSPTVISDLPRSTANR